MSSEHDGAFANRVVLVTGGTRGIGRVIATSFLAAGAEVVVCARHAAREPVAAAGRTAGFIETDVRDVEAIDRLITCIVERHGRLDVLVNNAGGSPQADTANASPRFSAAIIDLNLVAPLNLCQRANAVMQDQDAGGVIVNIASVSGTRATPGTAAYGAAKAGLINLAKTLAVEWAPKVRVNTVIAGLIETEFGGLHYGDTAAITRVAATVPLGRMGRPQDVADACLFLASGRAAYVSGSDLVVDGGGQWPAFLTALRADGSEPA